LECCTPELAQKFAVFTPPITTEAEYELTYTGIYRQAVVLVQPYRAAGTVAWDGG
jgi:hypothetical protein